ncbi:MAG: endonuclease/exonuclease/phosphatase family protein [Candidatus Aenigmarchaeota archaeon]|nr:endonuclease/exonuclease/phosphatase family protein [Candidatus Aenigmarchaeota archaeon]
MIIENKMAFAGIILVIVVSGCVSNSIPLEPTTSTTTTTIPTTTTNPATTTSTTTTTTPTTTLQPVSDNVTKIKIAAFNIQVFGKSKAGKPEVMDIISKIAREFDIVLVQEIRDSTGETSILYLNEINKIGQKTYSYVISERLGRTTSKEAYAYYYNNKTVNFTFGYVFNDTNDAFEREPYIASFKSGNLDFTLVGVHIKPDDAKQEIGNLTLVVNSIITKTPQEKDVIVMGDFNADGSYFNENDVSNPFKAAEFQWIITNDMDTMVKTNNTYDRIVITNATNSYEYVNNSASVFYFDSVYGINNQTFVQEVSDHYPVYAEFYTGLKDDD